jgi:biopolymer transport protein ExbB/TolQ
MAAPRPSADAPRPAADAKAPEDRSLIRRIGAYPLVLIGAVASAVLVIVLIDAFTSDAIAVLLIDRDRATYPLTVQTVMWVVFALGIGELIVRAHSALAERAQLRLGFLPEDETTVLQGPDLRQLYAAARLANRSDGAFEGRFLPRLIQRVVTQFQTNQSIDQANQILNSSLDLYLHEIDLRYTMVRYVVWAIPALGFIGTVIGIALALAYAGSVDLQDPTLLAETTKRLAVAFNTTLLALAMSAVLVLIQHIVQAYEERSLNRAGQYCLDNLINRLFAG